VASSNDPSGIALDLGAGTFYWSDFIPAGNRTIRSANLDGSNAHVVVSGLGDPGGIALATLDGTMYFADTSSGKIYMSGLDGFDMSVVVEGLSRAQGLAVISVAEPSAALMLIAGFVVMRLSRKRINRA